MPAPKHHLLIPGRFLSLALLFSFCLFLLSSPTILPSCIIPAGPALAGVFADPGTLKVLHGADSDVVWLQRDFGLFPVTMFDTGQAARVLEYPSFGLAHLLHHFCGFKVRSRAAPGQGWRRRVGSLPAS